MRVRHAWWGSSSVPVQSLTWVNSFTGPMDSCALGLCPYNSGFHSDSPSSHDDAQSKPSHPQSSYAQPSTLYKCLQQKEEDGALAPLCMQKALVSTQGRHWSLQQEVGFQWTWNAASMILDMLLELWEINVCPLKPSVCGTLCSCKPFKMFMPSYTILEHGIRLKIQNLTN